MVLLGIYEIDIQLDGEFLQSCPIICKAMDLNFKEKSINLLKCGEEFWFEGFYF